MADDIWTGLGGDGNFGDASNWSDGSVPGAADRAVIPLTAGLLTQTINANGQTVDTVSVGAGVTLAAANFTILGIPDADSTTGTSNVTGELVIDDDTTAFIAGTIDNTGTVLLDSSGYGDALYVGNASVSTLTLTGGGTLAMTDQGNNDIRGDVAGAVLDNVDNTIEGSGSIGDGNLTVVNAGTIAATGTGSTLVLGGAGVTNTALIEATGPAGLEIRETVSNAGGTILAAGGNAYLEGGADIVGGTLDGATGAVVLVGTPLLDGATAGAVTIAGTVELADDNDATAFGTLDNLGTLLLDSQGYGTSLYVGSGSISTLTLAGGGTVAMTDQGNNDVRGSFAGAVLDNTDNTIAGSGYVGDGDLAVVNAGTIAATGTGSTLVLSGTGVTNTGLIEAVGPAGLEIRDVVANTGGTIAAAGGTAYLEGGADIVGGTLSGGNGRIVFEGTPLVDGATAGAVVLQGTGVLADDNNMYAIGTLADDGTLLLDSQGYGTSLYVGEGSVSGLTLAGGGTLAMSDLGNNNVRGGVAGAVLDNAGDTIEGSGQLGDGNLTVLNAGVIAATGTATTLVLSGAGITNSALIEALGPAGLEIRETVVNAGATIAAAGGNVDIEGGADIVGGTLAGSAGAIVISATPLLDGATDGAITLTGSAILADDNDVSMIGDFNDHGTLLLDSLGYGTGLLVGSGSVSSLTLAGGGTLAMSDFGNNSIRAGVGGAVLDNDGDLIEGSGNIDDGNLSVVNSGTIAATGTVATLVLGGAGVTNHDLLEAAGPAGLEIRTGIVNQGGTILAASGHVELEGGADIQGGLLEGTGGVVTLASTPTLDASSLGSITLAGTAVLLDDNDAVAFGTLANDGTLLLDSLGYGTGLYVGDGSVSGLTLTGGGTLAMSDLGNNSIRAAGNGAVLDNAGDTIEGSGNIDDGNLSVVNAGTIAATGTAATLILGGAGVTNTALLEAAGPAGLEIRTGVVNAGGTIAAAGGNVDLEGGADIVGGTLAGTGGVFVLSGDPALDGATDGAIRLSGTAVLADDNSATAFGTLDNLGTLLLDSQGYGTALYLGGGSVSGLTLTGGGTVAMTDQGNNDVRSAVNDATLDNVDNTIEGSGQLGDGDMFLANAGTIEATGTSAALVIDDASFTNTGLVEAAGPAGLQIGSNAFVNNGTVLVSGSSAIGITSAVTGTGTMELATGSTVTLGAAVASGQTFEFLDASTLRLDDPAAYGGALEYLFAGVTIDLPDNNTSSVALVGNELEVVGDYGSLFLSVFGPTAGVTASLQPDGTGHEEIVFTGGSPPVVCFCAGTRIATPGGERAVETLAAGELVLTTDGTAQPIRWLGRQTVATRFADRLRVAPIRIRAGALGANLPSRDLRLSPDHAIMVDGVLVQAGALVNDVSITREDADLPERFTYFHVELASHALILADGVAAETFIDNVDRLAFDNWAEHEALGDETAPMQEMPHARAKAHRQVPRALHARLLALAGGAARLAC